MIEEQGITTARVGDRREFSVSDINRTHFVRYAGAGGDFNPIHHDQTFAERAGLPTVFGMGMFTAGVLAQVPSQWFGPRNVARYAVRFTSRLWPGDTLTCRGTVSRVYDVNGVAHLDLQLEALNQKGETLIEGEATIRPWQPT
ncbi:MAG: dihydroxy-acid dehydratase [Dehalococcoidia bacterium]|nr:dihydroxy-acid dehydratase [Dehalococcoidia bacterium]MCA9849997.1 dihydroxy-acid dehydratase [Dehalococcoidia bacterium]MCA9855695.1 dihydroxy-acid dehydratase [Dehalococcoidia bacterium]